MKIDQLLLDLGLNAGLSQPLRFDEHHCARLMVDGNLAIDFEGDTERGVLQVYSVLGELPAAGREALYRALLEANLFGADTAGATLAIDAHSSEVLLCRSVLAEEATSASFQLVVEQLIEAAIHWKKQLANFSASENTAPEQASPAMSLPIEMAAMFARA